MAFNYMPKSVITHLVNMIKAQLYTYAECSTGRSTVAKVIPLDNFILKKGATIRVRFTTTETTNPTSGNITLNVNNTGAKPLVYGFSNKAVINYSWAWEFSANRILEFVYDGANWVYINRDSNTTNTAGASNKKATKLFLVGTTAQNNGITSYSNANCYIGTDNTLYSNGSKVLSMNDSDNVALLSESDL